MIRSLLLLVAFSATVHGQEKPDVLSPVTSPDGQWIAFRSTRPRPDGWKPIPLTPPQSDAATDVWLQPAKGGDAIPLAGPEKPYGRVFNDSFFTNVAFSPDGKKLVFVADEGKDPRTEAEIQNGVFVNRADGGEGYTGYGPAHVWVATLSEKPDRFAATKFERITTDDAWYGDPQWLPDGKTVVVHANRTSDRESVRYSINKNYDLWAIDVETKAIRQLTHGPGPEFSPRVSPDGKRIACLSSPRKGPHVDVWNLALVELDEAEPRFHVVYDFHASENAKPRHPSPAFPLPKECFRTVDYVTYNADVEMETRAYRINPTTGHGEFVPIPASLPKPWTARPCRAL